MTINERIVKWNKERHLTENGIDIFNETCFIIEELLELQTPLKSVEARLVAEDLANDIKEIAAGYEPNEEQMVDALGDIVVFAVGAMAKLGYTPDAVMHEVLREIESRVGKEDETGKWVKDTSPEAIAQRYKADFSLAKF